MADDTAVDAAAAQSPTPSASDAGDVSEGGTTTSTPQKQQQQRPASSSPPPSATAGSSSRPIKERHSLSLEQRRALRRWASSQAVRPSHRACIEWFRQQYSHTISQSTVSHSLSPKYARLDGDPQLSGSRLRFGNWPDVEKLVLLWYGQTVSSGRHPTNEELADKAKDIFTQLPRYRDEAPPEFSPGWIHRFKKRYGLLMRRQRRHANHPDPAADVPYLVDAVPRFMSIGPDTSPAAIRDAVQRVVGVEPSLVICARVRDEIVRGLHSQAQQQNQDQGHQEQLLLPAQEAPPPHPPAIDPNVTTTSTGPSAQDYADDDPEVVLQNALRALQQEEAEAEAEAAAIREARDRADRGLPPLSAMTQQTYAQHAPATSLAPSTPPPPPRQPSAGASAKFTPSNALLTLTPIPAEDNSAAAAAAERPIRCPFCVNQRMLRSIKEAVEHMSTHVVI